MEALLRPFREFKPHVSPDVLDKEAKVELKHHAELPRAVKVYNAPLARAWMAQPLLPGLSGALKHRPRRTLEGQAPLKE